jgi:hypothetical protein
MYSYLECRLFLPFVSAHLSFVSYQRFPSVRCALVLVLLKTPADHYSDLLYCGLLIFPSSSSSFLRPHYVLVCLRLYIALTFSFVITFAPVALFTFPISNNLSFTSSLSSFYRKPLEFVSEPLVLRSPCSCALVSLRFGLSCCCFFCLVHCTR